MKKLIQRLKDYIFNNTISKSKIHHDSRKGSFYEISNRKDKLWN